MRRFVTSCIGTFIVTFCYSHGALAAWDMFTIEAGLKDSTVRADGARPFHLNPPPTGVEPAQCDNPPAGTDCYIDIITQWESSAKATYYKNPGPGSVTSAWTEKVDIPRLGGEDAYIDDVTGDGKLDLVGCKGNELYLYTDVTRPACTDLGDQTCTSQELVGVAGTHCMYSRSFDVDADGDTDIVSVAKEGEIAWFENPGQPAAETASNWIHHEMYPSTPRSVPMELRIVNMNQDEYPDVFYTDRKITAWLMNPQENYTENWVRVVISPQGHSMFSDVVDLDGDGLLDVVVAYRGAPPRKPPGLVWFKRLNNEDNSYDEYPINIPELMKGDGSHEVLAKAAKVADFDGNGVKDIVLSMVDKDDTNVHGIGLFSPPIINGVPVFTNPNWSFTPIADNVNGSGKKFDDLLIVDIDDDGDLDIVTSEEAETVNGDDVGLGVVWYRNPLSTVPEYGDFYDNKNPTLSISRNAEGQSVYATESIKYHVLSSGLPILAKPPNIEYVIKVTQSTEVTSGIEGSMSKIVLELWQLGSGKVGNRIWHIDKEAHDWKIVSNDQLVLIHYGCCGAPQIHSHYSLKSGEHLHDESISE